MPEVFMPGHELGFVINQGRPKLNCVATWSSIFTRLILGRLILLVTDPGGRRHVVAHSALDVPQGGGGARGGRPAGT